MPSVDLWGSLFAKSRARMGLEVPPFRWRCLLRWWGWKGWQTARTQRDQPQEARRAKRKQPRLVRLGQLALA